MDTEFDAVPELVPDWNRHARLASEMHCTIAHRLTSHTHPTRSPVVHTMSSMAGAICLRTSRMSTVFTKNQQISRLNPSFLASGRAMAKPT